MIRRRAFAWRLEPLLVDARGMLSEKDDLLFLAQRIARRRRAHLQETREALEQAKFAQSVGARTLDEAIRTGRCLGERIRAERRLRHATLAIDSTALLVESAAEESRRADEILESCTQQRNAAEAGVKELERLRTNAERAHLREIERADERLQEDECIGRFGLTRRGDVRDRAAFSTHVR